MFLPVSVFCAGYLPRYLGRYSLRAFGIMYLALYASIVLILTAGDVLLFLLAWEVMSILTYLLVNYEHEEPAHTQAGYVMLAFSEAGTLAAVLGLLVLAISAGSFDFASLKAAAPALGHGREMGRVSADVFRFCRQGGSCAGELLAAAGLYRCAVVLSARAGRGDVEPGLLRHHARQSGPGSRHAAGGGPDRSGRGNRLRLSRHLVRDDGERPEDHARAQFH